MYINKIERKDTDFVSTYEYVNSCYLCIVNHENYIRRCFDLAKRGIEGVSPNPIVGCCIVHEGRIIGEGWHQQYGEAHAEVNAFASVQEADKHLLKKATVYVSLEPCCYYGNTPPCTDLLIRHKISHVVISATDPNPRIAGGGVKQLRKHGIEVTTGILEEEGNWLARRFFVYVGKKRPYIILKFARSTDGFISKKGEQTWLTGKASKQLVHKWRSEEDAILIGTNTAEIDNPQLTNRLYHGKSPLRVVLDRQLRLSPSLNIYKDDTPTLIITDNTSIPQHSFIHTDFAQIDFSSNRLEQIVEVLYQRKTKSLIVEGGAELLQGFIQADLWDEARIFTAQRRLSSGIKAPKISGEIIEKIALQKDILSIYKNK